MADSSFEYLSKKIFIENNSKLCYNVWKVTDADISDKEWKHEGLIDDSVMHHEKGCL